MWWKILLSLLGGGILAPLVTFLLAKYLPNSTLEKWGADHGRLLSSFLRQKLGQKMEDTIESIIHSYIDNLLKGLRENNRK